MEFIIEKAKAKNTESLEGVIFKVWWRATKEDAVRYASKELPEPSDNFIPLEEITKEVLASWFSDEEKAQIEAELDAILEAKALNTEFDVLFQEDVVEVIEEVIEEDVIADEVLEDSIEEEVVSEDIEEDLVS